MVCRFHQNCLCFIEDITENILVFFLDILYDSNQTLDEGIGGIRFSVTAKCQTG